MDRLTDDVAAAARTRSGDALSLIYEVLAPRVRGYLLTRGADDPDGLTNEVFIQVIDRIETVQGGASGLRTFVFSVTHARLVDDLRRRSRRPQDVTYDADRDARTEPSAERAALHGRLSADLAGPLSRLTDDQRSVLLLRTVAGLSEQETASTLERSLGSVKQLHRRALQALRAALSGPEAST